MKTAEIKRRWLEFFEQKGHTVVHSAPLVSSDPNLMFVVAGMVPFIPFMTGAKEAPFKRATSVQKCVRTLDIEEVGKTTRHGTFFQMNGNFSFGDYFKREAIAFAWELLTKSVAEGGYGFDPERLWVTVYEDDDEAIGYWLSESSVPIERIQKRGMRDNFWSTGARGPAGPCSEIYFDRGPAYGVEGGPVADENRYIEIWNLVFMQYERADGGTKDSYEMLGELPKKNIDTGMGLERVAFLLQGVENIYEIDQVKPLIDLVARESGVRYGSDESSDVQLRVIADHIRSALMLMSDGVSPSNEGRGYVLRRLLRRSIRSLRLLGVTEPLFADLFEASYLAMVDAYPELADSFARVQRAAVAEENGFRRTLENGLVELQARLAQAKTLLSGADAFLLHDTFGFPIDLTEEIASEAGKGVNRSEFEALMAEQRERAKTDAKSKRVSVADLKVLGAFAPSGTQFVGYETLHVECEILGLLRDGESVATLDEGEVGELVLNRTPLYAESGGQAADAGWISTESGKAQVLDVQRPVKGLSVHRVLVTKGQLVAREVAFAQVDPDWRLGACQAHSGTHVVHAALRQVLGPEALQSGSYNRPGYLRLDYSWSSALSNETRSEVEEVANLAIRSDLPVSAQFMSLPEAERFGAIALFGETYDESVRVIEVGGPWSRELCGGTHVLRSSQIGSISLTSEASVGSGLRRVEADVGLTAIENLSQDRQLLRKLGDLLKAPTNLLEEKIQNLQDEVKSAGKLAAELETKLMQSQFAVLKDSAEKLNDCVVVIRKIDSLSSADSLRNAVIRLLDSLGEMSIFALGAVVAGKPILMIGVGLGLVNSARDARQLAGTLGQLMGGGGGGKSDLAQAGASSEESLQLGIQELRKLV